MAKERKLEINGKSQWHGSDMGMVQMNGMEVARTQEEWANLWEFRRGCFTPHDEDLTPGKLPEGVMAIAIFVSHDVACGYDIHIKEIKETKDRINVNWFLVPNYRTGMDTSAESRFYIKLVPYSDKGVEFRQVPPPERSSTHDEILPPQLDGPGM